MNNCSPQVLTNSVPTMDISSCQPPPFDELVREEEAIIIEEVSKVLRQPEQTLNKDHSNFNDKNDVTETTSNLETISLNDCSDYPIELKHDPEMGRCLVAARDIEPGEVILSDCPLFQAPNAEEKNNVTCLGCCLIAQDPESCPKCGWSVCCEKCSIIPQHADFECRVFSRENIKPMLPSPYSFIDSAEYIKILRCLLLKDESSPEKMARWKQIESLEAHMEIRRNIPRVQIMSWMVKRFIRTACKLNQYDEATIDFVLGVVDVNAFRHSFAPEPLKRPKQRECPSRDGPFRNATFLYPKASMAAHGCVRNIDWKTLPGGHLEMWASIKIPKGEVVSHAYVDLMLGTPERRRLLRNLFYFDCTCARCSDPTEMNTFFSVLKCPQCTIGYLLMANPLEYKSDWVCNNDLCKERKSFKFERDVVQQIRAEEKIIYDQIPVTTNNITIIKGLMKILKNHRNVTVHPNHYRLVSIEYLLVRYLLRMEKPAVTIMQEMKRLIKKHMQISSVFHPCETDNTK